MFDVETLLNMGLPNQLISVWQVFLFIGILVPFLFLHRLRLVLLITYMFTYYLAFITYWGNYIMSARSMTPFLLYGISGLAIVVLFVAASFTEEGRSKRNDD